jgi:hypothetical protein
LEVNSLPSLGNELLSNVLMLGHLLELLGMQNTLKDGQGV